MRKWYLTFHFGYDVIVIHHTVTASGAFAAVIQARSELIEQGEWTDILDQSLTSVTFRPEAL